MIGTKKTVIEVTSDEINQLIEKTYGQKLPTMTEHLWNDFPLHLVHFVKRELTEYEKGLIKDKETCNMVYLLMQDMVNNDLLEPGDYLIDVCW